jgi:hypothetical protein
MGSLHDVHLHCPEVGDHETFAAIADALLRHKQCGPGEASLIHSVKNSTTGNHKEMLSKTQVMSRIGFQEGT